MTENEKLLDRRNCLLLSSDRVNYKETSDNFINLVLSCFEVLNRNSQYRYNLL